MNVEQSLAGPSSRPAQSGPLQCTQCFTMSPIAVFVPNQDGSPPSMCWRCAQPQAEQTRWTAMFMRMAKKIHRARKKEKKRSSLQLADVKRQVMENRVASALKSSLAQKAPGAQGSTVPVDTERVPDTLTLVEEPLRSAIWVKMLYRHSPGHSVPQGKLYQRYITSISPYSTSDPRYKPPIGVIPPSLKGIEFIGNIPIVFPSVVLSREGYICQDLEERPPSESLGLWEQVYKRVAEEAVVRQKAKAAELSKIAAAGRLAASQPSAAGPSPLVRAAVASNKPTTTSTATATVNPISRSGNPILPDASSKMAWAKNSLNQAAQSRPGEPHAPFVAKPTPSLPKVSIPTVPKLSIPAAPKTSIPVFGAVKEKPRRPVKIDLSLSTGAKPGPSSAPMPTIRRDSHGNPDPFALRPPGM